jgi:rare lipoprotein A (peptidoglycan hydrolase)
MSKRRTSQAFVNEPPAARRVVFFWVAAVALGAVQVLGLLISPDRSVPRFQESAAAGGEQGVASWYGEDFHGLATASGEPFDMYAMTAAHPTLPLGTRVRVHNLDTGRTVMVRINDRGPYKRGVIIDLSRRAAGDLGMVREGRVPVRVEVVPG